MKTKKMKVAYSSKSRPGTYLGGSTYTTTPKISMEGKWLEALGFHIGDAITVSYEDNCIRITPASERAVVCESHEPYASSDSKPSHQ